MVGRVTMPATLDPNTPVLVGLGLLQQHEDDPTVARDAFQLMLAATRAAGVDAGSEELLSQIDLVSVPKGQWRYSDPGRQLATTLGSERATSVQALVGVLQQTLIGDACQRIAEGAIDVALVVGAEARYRRLRERITGVRAPDTVIGGEPDEVLQPTAELVLGSEMAAGLGGMPVGYYAIIESALRAARGLSVEAHRDQLAALYHRFSEIAADNPHAWRRDAVPAAVLRGPSKTNPMLAFPYTKLHNSSWNVDQAAALLFCSVRRAEALGVSRSRWVFPLASTETNHMTSLSERADLASCPGARIAGRRALEIGGVTAAALSHVELYTCFPAAVQLHAEEIGIPATVDWTVTGAMPFAGGPFNNYVLQSTGRMIELLRQSAGSTGLVSSVSGVLTKQGFGLWSSSPGPGPFVSQDLTEEVAAATVSRPVVERARGRASIAGYTVMYDGETRRGVALVDLVDGSRCMVGTNDEATIERMEHEELCGRFVDIDEDGELR